MSKLGLLRHDHVRWQDHETTAVGFLDPELERRRDPDLEHPMERPRLIHDNLPADELRAVTPTDSAKYWSAVRRAVAAFMAHKG